MRRAVMDFTLGRREAKGRFFVTPPSPSAAEGEGEEGAPRGEEVKACKRSSSWT
jgi:hypothetical protein